MASEIYKGRDLRIKVEGKTVFHATECSFSSSMNIDSVATKDTIGEVGTPSTLSWTLSTNALMTNAPSGSTTTQGTKSIFDYHTAGTRVSIEFTTGVNGDMIISGEAYIESCEIQAPVQGNATFSASFKGDGNYTTDLVD